MCEKIQGAVSRFVLHGKQVVCLFSASGAKHLVCLRTFCMLSSAIIVSLVLYSTEFIGLGLIHYLNTMMW